MHPRLKTSLKAQDFPLDYIKMIRDVIGKNFKKDVKDKNVLVQGLIYPEEILIRIGFQDKGALTQRGFEASIGHSISKKNIMEQIYVALDALGSMIEQYFKAEGDLELPKTWNSFDLDGQKVFLMTSTENPDLEALADEFLKKSRT